MKFESKEKANEYISNKLKEISEAIHDCEEIADEFELMFDSPIYTYGMGGTYFGATTRNNDEDGWRASSQSC